MTKRNLWGYEETLTLISIIDEKECLQKIEEKKYKSKNHAFQIVEQEMFARGYYDKNAKQMEFRWQNLKKNFYRDRKILGNGDKTHKVSPYYDNMEIVLSNCRKVNKQEKDTTGELSSLTVNPVENGNATSTEEEEQEQEQSFDHPKTEMPAFEECFPTLPASKPLINLKRRREPDTTPPRIDQFQQKIKMVTKELNEDLFRKQKELIEYEFRLFANYTSGRDEKFKEMMSTNTQTFLQGIKDLMQENNKTKITMTPKSRLCETREVETEDHNIKQFFQSWDQEAGNRK